MMQCYHYMAVTGKRTWYIACVILGRGFTYSRLTWDDTLIQQLIEIEKEFWEGHVVPGIMPAPDGSDDCDNILNRYFGDTKKSGVVELVGFDEKLERRAEILAEIERLQNEQKRIDQEIKLYMKENELAANDRYRVSWSSVATTRLDTKQLREEKPEIYADYAKTTSSRRFTVKAA